jgi:general secretion pathway protein A
MAAYIRFYQFDASPFGDGNAKPGMVLGTHSLRGALAKVKQGLSEDSPRICLTGSAGVGKTSFSRALPKLLADSAQVAVILDPRRPWRDIRATITKRFNLQGGAISRKALLAARESSKQLVLVIDQAEALSHESLDHLDILLQYKCDDDKQLLHCVMMADLDGASSGTEIPLLWWLDKFTTLQLQFSPIPAEGLRHYVEKHLAKAGWAGGELFTEEALVSIHRNTGGVPRAINELCEKILIEGGMRGINSISSEFIEALCSDSADEEILDAGLLEDPELSADASIGDFNTPQTAQEMLDENTRDAVPSDAEARVARKQLLEPAADMASLLVTQDSSEPLHVATAASQREDESSSLELEEEPKESPPTDFDEHTKTVGAPIGMTRLGTTAPARRSRVGLLLGVGVAGAIVYFLATRVSVPTQLIESAEVRISEVIEQRTGIEFKLADQRAEEPERAPSLVPSILDRDDLLEADPELDIVSLPETIRPSASEKPNEQNEPTDALADARPDGEASTKLAAETKLEEVREPTSTIRITSEPVMFNEYTAIPEAASVEPRPATPAESDSTSISSTTVATTTSTTTPTTTSTKPAKKAKFEPVPASGLERVPTSPAKLAPDPEIVAAPKPEPDRETKPEPELEPEINIEPEVELEPQDLEPEPKTEATAEAPDRAVEPVPSNVLETEPATQR